MLAACRTSHSLSLGAIALLMTLLPSLEAVEHDYSQVMQVGLAFLEVNECGAVSPLNRFDWRADSCMSDGADVGLDLTGGWYDAGDQVKANTTMAKAASHLAWSVITFPEIYERTGQMPYALNSLRHVADYFRRCVVDPHPADPTDFSGYEVYVDIGSQTFALDDPSGTKGSTAPHPKVHSVWSPAEMIDGITVRESKKVTADNPNCSPAGGMAATLASIALVFQRHGTDADRAKVADYYATANKLSAFGRTYRVADGSALRPNGEKVHVLYLVWDRDEGTDNLIWSELWLHMLGKEIDSAGYDDRHIDNARQILADWLDGRGMWNYTGSWMLANYNHHSLMLWLQTGDATADERADFENEVEKIVDIWDKADGAVLSTPFGLRYKSNNNAFLLHGTLRQSALAAMYADYTSDTGLRDRYVAFLRSQIDYLLGDNKQEQSYLIGYGDNPLIYHHRQAHGTWDDNQYWKGADYFMPRMRHVAYGAILGGPDKYDNYTVDEDFDFGDHHRCEPVIGQVGHLQIAAAYLTSLDPEAYAVDPDFPAPDERILTDDPEWTDHEIYVAARVASATTDSLTLETAIYNRSSWPARIMTDASYRYYFTADAGGTTADDFTLTVSSDDGGIAGGIVHVADDLFYAEVRFPGEILKPHKVSGVPYWRKAAALTITAASGTFDPDNDHSGADLPTGADQKVVLPIPVYEGAQLAGGNAPVAQPSRRIGLQVTPVPDVEVDLQSTPAAMIEQADPAVYSVQTDPGTSILLWFERVLAADG